MRTGVPEPKRSKAIGVPSADFTCSIPAVDHTGPTPDQGGPTGRRSLAREDGTHDGRAAGPLLRDTGGHARPARTRRPPPPPRAGRAPAPPAPPPRRPAASPPPPPPPPPPPGGGGDLEY